MILVKKPFVYEEMIEKMRSKGCVIDDETYCKKILEEIGYYKLSAYFTPFKNEDGIFIDNVTFNKIYQVYEFDRKLRYLLFGCLEAVEVSLKSKISYFFSHKYGSLGYLDSNNFNNKHNHNRFMENINKEIDSNKNISFVKHHILKYDGKFPLWAICELFTFGTISYFYNDLTTADKKAIFASKYKDAIGWIRCCTDLRNICAHYGRLYYRIFSAMPSGFNISEYHKRRLWGAILALRELYPSPDKWNLEFLPQLKKLFDNYNDYIDLNHISFPSNWYNQLVI